MNKTIYVKLKRVAGFGSMALYTVTELKNAAGIPLNGKTYRVGDEMPEAVADTICTYKEYEVTVSKP